MRARLTLAVALTAGCFLALAALLLSRRASSLVLDGVVADNIVAATGTFTVDVPPGSNVVTVYEQLDNAGLLPSFFQLIGEAQPSAGQPVVVALPNGNTLPLAGQAASPSNAAVVSAATLERVGQPLLAGVQPGDLLVTSSNGAPINGVSGSVSTGSMLAVPIRGVRSGVASIGRDLWLGAALLTFGAAAATWLLTGRALRPVAAITRRVDGIARTRSGERVPVPSAQDEIGHLARTVNTMLDRLDDAADAQHRFVADASHELRSPLAVIRAETEVALAHPGQASWVDVGHAVLDETGRLERLVDDLLVLARDESTGAVPGAVAAGTAAITDVEEIAMAEARRARRLPVDTSAVLAGRVIAHREDVARVVRHLLDNAARHGTSHVALTVVPDESSVLITVDDDGPGVPESERARIFERFARLEDSRSRDAGGAGLGLAVVSVVVRRLGGTIEVIDAPAGGARFNVRLPAAEPSIGTSSSLLPQTDRLRTAR